MRRNVFTLCGWVLALTVQANAASSAALMYLGTWPHKIDVVDANSGTVVDRINVDTDVVRELVLSPDHKTLYAQTLKGNCIVTVDLAARKETASYCLDSGNQEARLGGIAVDPSGKYMYAVETTITKNVDYFKVESPKFLVIDLAAKSVVRMADLPKDEPPSYRAEMKFSPDGKYLYLFRDGIQVFDTSTLKLVKKIDMEQPPVPDMLNLSLNLVDDPNEGPDEVIGLFRSEDPFVHRETFGIGELNLSSLTFHLTPLGPVTTTVMSPLMLTPDRSTAYTAVVNGVNGNRVTEFWAIDMKTKKVVAQKQFTGRTRFNFGMTADGSKLLIYNAGFQIEEYDAKTMEMVKDIDLEGDTTSNLIVMPQSE